MLLLSINRPASLLRGGLILPLPKTDSANKWPRQGGIDPLITNHPVRESILAPARDSAALWPWIKNHHRHTPVCVPTSGNGQLRQVVLLNTVAQPADCSSAPHKIAMYTLAILRHSQSALLQLPWLPPVRLQRVRSASSAATQPPTAHTG